MLLIKITQTSLLVSGKVIDGGFQRKLNDRQTLSRCQTASVQIKDMLLRILKLDNPTPLRSVVYPFLQAIKLVSFKPYRPVELNRLSETRSIKTIRHVAVWTNNVREFLLPFPLHNNWLLNTKCNKASNWNNLAKQACCNRLQEPNSHKRNKLTVRKNAL